MLYRTELTGRALYAYFCTVMPLRFGNMPVQSLLQTAYAVCPANSETLPGRPSFAPNPLVAGLPATFNFGTFPGKEHNQHKFWNTSQGTLVMCYAVCRVQHNLQDFQSTACCVQTSTIWILPPCGSMLTGRRTVWHYPERLQNSA